MIGTITVDNINLKLFFKISFKKTKLVSGTLLTVLVKMFYSLPSKHVLSTYRRLLQVVYKLTLHACIYKPHLAVIEEAITEANDSI